MPNGPMRITSGPFEPDLYKSEMEVQDAELKVSVGWNVVSNVAPVLGMRTKCQQSPKNYNTEKNTLLPPHSSEFVFLFSPTFQALLQSSASRKTQKKKKKKVCYDDPSSIG